MRNRAGSWLLLIGGLCACRSLDVPPQNSRECLALAQTYLEEQQYELALTALGYFDPDALSLDDQSLWYLILGTANHRLGKHWAAYEEMRTFAIKRQFRRHSEPIANLLYEVGEALARRKTGSFLWFDRGRAKAVLKTLVSYYPANPHRDDAQYRLGELAYEDGDFVEARLRFSSISVDSVWNTKSLFRVAMCYYRNLHGPDYDLGEMEQARKELTGFLESRIENPKYRKVAAAALANVHEMLAEKHRIIADFYFEIENQRGGLLHLQLAADKYPESRAGQEAQERLRKLRGPPTPPKTDRS